MFFKFVFESVNGFGSLVILILSELFDGLFSAVCSIELQGFRVCILEAKAGYLLMDGVEP